MEEEIYESLNQLRDALNNDERIKKLNGLEEMMYQNEEVIELTKKKNALEDQYGLVLSYSDMNSEEAKKVQKALFEAKLQLDSHPLVKEYNACFIEVRDLYMQIDDIIFGPFRKKTLSSEAK